MPRAHRHFVAGQIWHITQRCHSRQFLLRYEIDRRRWLYWLFQARRRYGLSVLNYVVTSNHVHLLVHDSGNNAIADAMQLIAGRTAQEYNRRSGRSGAFWEERYHATAVEAEGHLARCMLYIDMNMVRTGAVAHPIEWKACGYQEVMHPRRRGARLDLPRTAELLGFGTLFELQQARRRWVEERIEAGPGMRDSVWTESVAVGSLDYALKMRRALAISNPGREPHPEAIGWSLREDSAIYEVSGTIFRDSLVEQGVEH